ncbi:MAG: PHP domain-containing protein [Clostridia bacterium]|nr:PHP domain-containing protein [Clostridia bacterium]MDO5303527.1 PHP domain-containing protein [Clostridia bacterium]
MEINFDKYKMIFDYHTHTTFSHGKGSIEDNVKAAIDAGLSELAITDHGPGHLTYGVKRTDFPVMRAEIDRLNEVYPQVKIYLGVEANIISVGNYLDVSPDEMDCFDFILAGYHYGIPRGYCVSNWLDAHGLLPFFGSDLLVKNTDMTLKALYENDIKILTHPGDKGRFDIDDIAKACADTDTLMEISTWHDHLTVEEIKIAAKYDVKFVISSDAHTPDRVGSFHGGIERAIEAGLDIERIVNIREV